MGYLSKLTHCCMKTIYIGRNRANNIVIDDDMISRRHLKITQHTDGNYTLQDLGSLNGTFVNGQKVQGKVTLVTLDRSKRGTSAAAPFFANWIAKNSFTNPNDVMSAISIATKKDELVSEVTFRKIAENNKKSKLVSCPTSNYQQTELSKDLIGQIIYDPKEESYFPQNWRWEIEEGEVIGVQELNSITDNNGNKIEIRTETLPNGAQKVTKITKDRNGNIIGQSVSINNNGFNNFNAMNNMNMGMNNMNMGMNNMNMGMNNMFGMNMMNNMFGMMENLGQMMNNMDGMINNANNGVDPNILNNLEVTKISDVSKLNEDNKKCIICLEDFKEGDEGIYLPCFHLFHKDCIKEWLNAHDDCPICKFKLTYENINRE